MAKIVTIINFKGGVGKTICSVEIATSLAKYYGRRVLLVDLDPQASASLFVMQSQEQWKAHRDSNGTTFNLFNKEDAKTFSISKAIVRDVVPGVMGFDLLPSSPELVDVDLRLVEFIGYNTLKRYFEQVQDDYDYIICDCPPNFNPVTKNSLWASDAYIVPTFPDYLSTYGIGLLQGSVNKFFTLANDTGHAVQVPVPVLGGIIVTRFKTNAKAPAQFYNQLQHEYPGHVFKHIVHDSIVVANAPDEHMPVSALPRPNGKAIEIQEQFKGLAGEFISRIHHLQKAKHTPVARATKR
jgi:chromosome partitioning protein